MDSGNLLLLILLLLIIFVIVAIASGVDLFKDEKGSVNWVDETHLAGFSIPSNTLKKLQDLQKIKPIDKVIKYAAKWTAAIDDLPRPYQKPLKSPEIDRQVNINQEIDNRPAQDQVHRRISGQRRRDAGLDPFVDRYARPLAKPWVPALSLSQVETDKTTHSDHSKLNQVDVIDMTVVNTVSDQFNDEFEINFADIHLDKLIGSGGFGAVWSGVWRGTDVAVKMIAVPQSIAKSDHADLTRSFKQELRMISSLRHPNICLFMGACIDPDHLVIMTELLTNGSLWECLRNSMFLVKDGGAGGFGLPWTMIKKILMGTARGMNYLHLQSPPILHRDLKSPNLLLDESQNIKICDFGLARTRECTGGGNMTKYCGTVQWMSPEVMEGLPYTESADVYSYGMVIWEVLTRQCPFDGENQVQIALKVCRMHQRPIIPDWCNTKTRRAIETSWSQSSKDRPSFQELVKTIIPAMFD